MPQGDVSDVGISHVGLHPRVAVYHSALASTSDTHSCTCDSPVMGLPAGGGGPGGQMVGSSPGIGTRMAGASEPPSTSKTFPVTHDEASDTR